MKGKPRPKDRGTRMFGRFTRGQGARVHETRLTANLRPPELHSSEMSRAHDHGSHNRRETEMRIDLRDQIRQVIDSLAEKEREILTMRFGLDDGRIRTLREVGQTFNISRERVRQMEAKALSRLNDAS